MHFEPQSVEASSWRTWAVEGLQLSARRPLSFIVLTLLYASLDYLPPALGLQFWLTPVFLGLGCLVGRCADKSVAVSAICNARTARAALNLVTAALLPLAALLAVSSAVHPTPLPPVVFEGGLGILIVMFLWMLFVGPLLWFLAPLMAVEGLSLRIAAAQSWDALHRNFFVYGLTLAVTLVAAVMIALGSSVAAIVLYPILSCVMYVSYRHIWFNRAQNEPEPTRRRSAAAAAV